MLTNHKNYWFRHYIIVYVLFVFISMWFVPGCATTQVPTPVPTTNDLERGYDPSWQPDSNNNVLDCVFNALSGAAGVATILSFF